jgi:hypothetical protein
MIRYFKKHPEPLTTPDLIKLALARLPLPERLIADAAAAYASPESLLDLRSNYESLASHPAWQHFTGRLLDMKQRYEQAILVGEKDRQGNDVTDKMRAAYGTLLQILAIPAQVEQLHKQAEETLIGLPQIDQEPQFDS